MNMIACIDKNYGIGYEGNLLFDIPEDKAFFKSETMRGVCIMGRNTLESLPGRKPLKNRVNIVISKTLSKDTDGIIVVRSVREAINKAKVYDKSIFMSQTYIIGGESIYKKFINYVDCIYLTVVDAVKDSDRKFPKFLKKDGKWSKLSTLFEGRYEGIHYRCDVYHCQANMLNRKF